MFWLLYQKNCIKWLVIITNVEILFSWKYYYWYAFLNSVEFRLRLTVRLSEDLIGRRLEIIFFKYRRRTRTLAVGRRDLFSMLILRRVSEAHLGSSQTSNMGLLAKKLNGWKSLAIFAKNPTSIFGKILNTHLNLMVKLTLRK